MPFLDRLLLRVAPDVYYRRQTQFSRERLAPRLYGLWEEALRLPGAASLEESFLVEIQEYFHLSRDEALARLEGGADGFAAHFAGVAPDLSDGEALARVYDETTLEIYELAEWHARRFDDGPHNYALALQAAREIGARRYLDYGSGIGSGAILFARHGIEVTLADVSSPMLDFARWRLERRKLPYRAIHLRSQDLGREVWDVVTLLDVLEHVADPLALLGDLRVHLAAPGGLMIVRAPFDDVRPQHIPHDPRTLSLTSRLGYRYVWERMGSRGLPVVLAVSGRGRLGDSLAGFLDDRVWGMAAAASRMARAARLRLQGRDRSALS